MKLNYNQFLLTIVVCFNICINSFGQDIYNISNSKKYAEHLFKNKEFKKAAIEFERVCFLDSNDFNSKLKLIKSYRKDQNYMFAISSYKKFENFIPDSLKSDFKHEYHISRLNNNFTYFISDTFDKNEYEYCYFKIPAIMLSADWKKSNYILFDTNLNRDKTINLYIKNYNDALKIRTKNKCFAAVSSAIIPGSGKIYTEYYKDGVIAFLFTGLSAYQAYRGYKSKGINSGIFILYSGITAGFYIGNIYGSYKSAKQRNRASKKKIDNKTMLIFNDWAD